MWAEERVAASSRNYRRLADSRGFRNPLGSRLIRVRVYIYIYSISSCSSRPLVSFEWILGERRNRFTVLAELSFVEIDIEYRPSGLFVLAARGHYDTFDEIFDICRESTCDLWTREKC